MEYVRGGLPARMIADPTATAARSAPSRVDLAYAGQGLDYFGLHLVNGALTMLTLGLYYPWARARELRFMIGSLVADGDAFTFHGTGGELFWGFLRAWVLFLLPLFGLAFLINLPGLDAALRWVLLLVFCALLIVLVSFAIVGSMRYRSSRTSWRGIRFGFDGPSLEFSSGYALRLLAQFLTLGLAHPHVATWRRDYMVSHARLGSERFGFDGVAGDLFARYLLCWFLALPTLGLSFVWFHGHQQAYYWNHTTLAGGRFRCLLTGSEWLGATLLNGLLVVFTFGFGGYFAYVNLHREFFRRLSLEGADLARIYATESEGSELGEGTAAVLDVAGGLDIG